MYELSKKMILKCIPENFPLEYNLFHGTNQDSIKSIIRGGFNRSYCGKNGTAYGQGVYFARDAAYSDKYSKAQTYPIIHRQPNLIYPMSNNINLSMILARVLVGIYQKGSPDMKDTAMRDDHSQYESTVDNVHNPTIFVIYKDFRAYPNYIINYTS
jgi:poly [ADP-ribose] polymerase 10/14/15